MSEGQHRPDRRPTEAPVVGLTGARFGGATGRRLRYSEPSPAGDETGATTSGAGQERPAVSLIGARFMPVQGRRRARSRPRQEAGQPPHQPVPSSPGSTPQLDPPAPPSDAARVPEAEWVVDEADWDGSEDSYGLVRPYAWTKGRTTPRHELALEALISAAGWNLDASASPEHHAILELCSTPRSVAEVAALLSVPLGVARVLLGDMAEAGNVVVHRTAGTADSAPDLALMQRVLSCLQRL